LPNNRAIVLHQGLRPAVAHLEVIEQARYRGAVDEPVGDLVASDRRLGELYARAERLERVLRRGRREVEAGVEDDVAAVGARDPARVARARDALQAKVDPHLLVLVVGAGEKAGPRAVAEARRHVVGGEELLLRAFDG